jgi:hypothetical protein
MANASYEKIQAIKASYAARRRKKPLIRIWNGDWDLFTELEGELGGGFEFIENDTGTAHLRLSLNHYAAKWIINFKGRAKRNVHVTFDKGKVRWGGRMDNYEVVKEKDGTRYLEVEFKHDFENLKHIVVWANPFLLAEIQFPKAWFLFGKARWCCATTLHFQLMRLEQSFWMQSDDPMDGWPTNSVANWSMVVKPAKYVEDKTDGTFVYSRFKTFYETVKKTLEDCQIHVESRRWLTGDPAPWPGANIRHGCLVFDFQDKSGHRTSTSFFGSLLTGLVHLFTDIGADGLTESETIIPNPNAPAEYFQPGYAGTKPEAPWVIFEEGFDTGIETSKFNFYEATDVQHTVGGHSMPGVNEAISAAVQMAGDMMGSVVGPSIGGSLDALLKPLYEDVFLAFMSWKSISRINTLGWSHYKEGFADGADRAYTLGAVISLRAAQFASKSRTAHELKIADACPYRVGEDFFVGDRVGTTVLGMPDENYIYVDRVMKAEYEWDQDGTKGWQIEVGWKEPADPFAKSLEMIRGLGAAMQALGLV